MNKCGEAPVVAGTPWEAEAVATGSFASFDLELGGWQREADGHVRFRVRAALTPLGQVQASEAADPVALTQAELDAVVATLTARWDVAEDVFAQACGALERWLLPSPSRVRALLEASLASLRAEDTLLLRLRCQDDELARVPWEFATFDRAGLPDDGRFHVDRTLAMHPALCVVRFDELAAPVGRARDACTPRLLFVNAASPAQPGLALEGERQHIEQALSGARTRSDATWIEHVTVGKLQEALRADQYDVFHYSGHGGASGGGFLCFEPDATGDGTFEAGSLGLLLAGKGVRVAVLAACVTAEIERTLPWSSAARALVAGGVPAVVGMQLNVPDDSAVAFTRTFYATLGAALPIGVAMNEARKAILVRPELARDFGVPVLYLRNAGTWDGRVFPLPPAEGALERKLRAADAYKRLHDSLHKAKMDAYHLLLRFADDFPPKSAFNERPLRSYVNTLKVCVNEMRTISAEGRCDADLIGPLIDALAQATAQLESALASRDHDTFADALPQLSQVFGREMSMLDVSLNNSAKEMPSLDAQGDAARADLGELRALVDELKLRVVTHHACQRLENLLDDLRDLRQADGVNVASLKRRRQELQALLQSCLGAVDPETGAALLQRCAALDASLAAADGEQLAVAYDDLCAEVGMSFYKIDNDLKCMCARLCADPRLAQLVAVGA